MLKVGDKVVITNTDYGSDELQNGNTGAITKVQEYRNKIVYSVLLDSDFAPFKFVDDQDDSWTFFEDQLELSE